MAWWPVPWVSALDLRLRVKPTQVVRCMPPRMQWQARKYSKKSDAGQIPARLDVERGLDAEAGLPALDAHGGGQGDHGAVVGAQAHLGIVDADLTAGTGLVRLR